MSVDGKKLLMDYLRSHPLVTAHTSSVRTTMPDETVNPWILVKQIDVTCRSEPVDHLNEYALQFDCYAGEDEDGKPGWPEANDLGYAVRDALKPLHGNQGGAVVTCVYVRGPREMIDPDLRRARTIVEADAYIHP